MLKEAYDDESITLNSLVTQAKESNWKIPLIHNHIFYRLIDILLIANNYAKKSIILFNNICSLDILNKHIEAGYKLPLSLKSLMLPLITNNKNTKAFH